MSTTLRRLFLLVLDTGIIVAFSFIGITSVKSHFYDLYAFTFFSDPPQVAWEFFRILLLWTLALTPCVVLWAVALLVLRIRRPRFRLRYLTRQPGMVACIVTVVVVTIRLVGEVLLFRLSGSSGGPWLAARTVKYPFSFLLPWPPPLELDSHFFGWVPEVGLAVAAAWLVQVMSGRWRSDPSWLNRVGLALGLFWIGMVLLDWLARRYEVWY
jgi:hypothetical protein